MLFCDIVDFSLFCLKKNKKFVRPKNIILYPLNKPRFSYEGSQSSFYLSLSLAHICFQSTWYRIQHVFIKI
jgi:hypothetical protein